MKEDIEISKELTARAWADMRARLDEEMPEKRKKRPAFWFWLSGMLGMAVLCLIGLESDTTSKAASISSFGVESLIEQLDNQPVESDISAEKQLDKIEEKVLNLSPPPNKGLEKTSPINIKNESKLEESLPEKIQFKAKKGEPIASQIFPQTKLKTKPIAASSSETHGSSTSSQILPKRIE